MPTRTRARTPATAYVVDANLYIEAEGNPAIRAALRDFLQRASRHVRVSTVVLHELLVGASTKVAREAVLRDVVTPFQRHLRLVETDFAVWQEAAAIAAAIRDVGGFEEKLKAANFRHDILIAASCRRIGATLVTANRRDFELIARARSFHFVSHFPM